MPPRDAEAGGAGRSRVRGGTAAGGRRAGLLRASARVGDHAGIAGVPVGEQTAFGGGRGFATAGWARVARATPASWSGPQAWVNGNAELVSAARRLRRRRPGRGRTAGAGGRRGPVRQRPVDARDGEAGRSSAWFTSAAGSAAVAGALRPRRSGHHAYVGPRAAGGLRRRDPDRGAQRHPRRRLWRWLAGGGGGRRLWPVQSGARWRRLPCRAVPPRRVGTWPGGHESPCDPVAMVRRTGAGAAGQDNTFNGSAASGAGGLGRIRNQHRGTAQYSAKPSRLAARHRDGRGSSAGAERYCWIVIDAESVVLPAGVETRGGDQAVCAGERGSG